MEEKGYDAFYRQKTYLEEKLQHLSDEKLLRKRIMEQGMEVQGTLVCLMDRVYGSDPSLEKSVDFIDSYYMIKEKSGGIIDNQMQDYEGVCKESVSTEDKINELHKEYRKSLEEHCS